MKIKAQDLNEGYWIHLSDGSRIRGNIAKVYPMHGEQVVDMEVNPTADTLDGMLYFEYDEEVEVELT